ncbi:hypothetical protein GW17_00030169 [Ensete ventricosum]|nr:hypothetical protein GW17_00030169 [Ensete ventricosum]
MGLDQKCRDLEWQSSYVSRPGIVGLGSNHRRRLLAPVGHPPTVDQVEWNDFSSGRLLVPAGRSGRVGSRRDPSDGQVSLVVDFAIPLLRRGAGAFIATVTGYPYLNPLSSLLLTIPLLLTTPSVILAARRAPAAEGCRPCPPYLC